MSVGQELLDDVPFPEMIASMGQGIADAQNQLDMNSVEVAKVLAETEIEVVPAITRTIDSGRGHLLLRDPDRRLAAAGRVVPDLLPVLGGRHRGRDGHQDDHGTRDRHRRERRGARRIGLWGGSIQTDVSHNRKFGKEVHGTSKLKTTMVPVPEPPYLFPEVETIDQRQPEDNEGVIDPAATPRVFAPVHTADGERQQ